ncbi:MAG: hypothetical protein L6R40_006684 [Gallowayella cf. fulva]|nr:MAG: hypothetical protein L6R40_006684 [Xanthomendoza cf. fulva]
MPTLRASLPREFQHLNSIASLAYCYSLSLSLSNEKDRYTTPRDHRCSHSKCSARAEEGDPDHAAMAAISPTPLGSSHEGFIRRAPSRASMRNQPMRPVLKRSSPLSAMHLANDGPLPQSWKFSMADSSDDEIPVPPMKFSAEAKAILGDEASAMEHSSPSRKRSGLDLEKENKAAGTDSGQSPPAIKPFRPLMRDKSASPALPRSGSPRIVRIKAGSAAPRSTVSSPQPQQSPPRQPSPDWITPAPRPRSLVADAKSNGSGASNANESGPRTVRPTSTTPGEPGPGSDQGDVQGSAAALGNLSIGRKVEETGVHTSIRVKRVGGVGGRYLSGPARRGMRRRQSEEDQSPVDENMISPEEPRKAEEPEAKKQNRATSPLIELREDAESKSLEGRKSQVRFQSQPNVIAESPIRDDYRLQRPLEPLSQLKQPLGLTSQSKNASDKHVRPMFKVPSLPPLPSRFDQENEPPPTFKRNKPSNGVLLDRPQKMTVRHDEKMLIDTPATASPPREALAPRSQNTPHRPAPPPPPKMTMLETATATAGAASASQSRKKRNYMSVNSKMFTRMDCIGRGGSSKVYRVMAENFKVFALKRVTLEDQDPAAIQGFKGEIDLLKKLENVDRVVRLFDYEINEEKQTLSVLMEMGESDLNRVLTLRLNGEDARFDITFTRYFWKEMLECVQAVHEHDIVHSDLKPANFLLLQGRLKLIDFGISNAISDNTVNVHREQHIGTPNYMSPEALIDSNAASGLPSSVGKMMKLGKPSDVWSLGCILYQMVYGKPPFGHIANQMQRIMAIPNPHHIIEFPDHAVGGVAVPFGLLRTLRRCLNRDQMLRPTVDEMLAPGDAFLDPDGFAVGTVPVGVDMIARIQHSMVRHIQERGMPTEAELAGWPQRYYASIKAAVEEQR